jgi:acyl-CoA thioesterase
VDYIKHIKQYLSTIYDSNSFVRLLDLEIDELRIGEAELTMPVNPAKHTNLYYVAHGGAVASLADTAMGVACATLGNRVVTIDMNINFIRSPEQNDIVRGIAKVIHNGRQTMVVEAEILDSANKLAAKARGTFMVIGKFEAVESNE